MEQRISLITLGVADVGRARTFYEALGWKRSVRPAKGVAFFQAGGMALSLYPRADLAADVGVAPTGAGFSGVTLAYNARTKIEVDAIIEEARGAGASMTRAAKDMFWGGYSGFFADPDGHLWEVAWNPSFAIAEDGSVRLPD
jgi:predicted lactoylglutathione lyase